MTGFWNLNNSILFLPLKNKVKRAKYAYISAYGSINALLFEQFLSFAGWCQQQKIHIITVANRTHNDARNWLATAGGGFSNPTQLIDAFDTLIWIDSDQVFTPNDVTQLLDCEAPFCTG